MESDDRINIKQNLLTVHKRIEAACHRVHRPPQDVRLLLACKTVPATHILLAHHLGERLIGENRVQEALSKIDHLQIAPTLEHHFIGHLQSNKVRHALRFATCIQSIDRLSLVRKLEQELQKQGRSLDILIQVNTSYEESKFGLHPDKTLAFIRQVSQTDCLKIKGLMTIGLFSSQPEPVRTCFRRLATLREQAKQLNLPRVEMETLSMGMSHDFETAIEEGATMIRIGSAIFGARSYPDSYYWNEEEEEK
ncbi:YggS family pyridoxal phosphate-dependent enzyme [Mechercharimyces sp. CAU 1602]|uniref:YggS family pyridoxal phosphate-dependent enzyme n=1 Tax=Mechercharimyces sp. CAU 1602 TaxID=2973933 RepID=UPI00216398C2|nr:YggS family pyridoxal phosphate-dependent enzyme [Mechercharimyces sp. CAU 1602]MCS1351838.1 YggS family pyridoxal phosphate-dependent enzyme [Mechercharimyces sp. CAU 1602]